jgi:hypothetical protein
MLHPTTDRLAELGDASPTAAEASHLAECATCAGERDAYVSLVGMARADRGALGVPLTRWEKIAAALDADVPAATGSSRPPVHRDGLAVRTTRWLMRIAAGLLLCAGGAMLGRASVGARLLPERAMEQADIARSPGSTATIAASRILGDPGSFATVDEARAAQQRSELVYEQAAAFLALHDSGAASGSPVAYRSRLAALDRVISTTREALREVPHDPVINDYYLTTIGQREVTLRQLNTALPASLRLNSF